MFKKTISVLYFFLKKIIYKNNTDIIKENTWQSTRTAKKFFKVHNEKKNYLFDDYISTLFLEKLKKNHKVLDVGCGTGRLTKNILSKTKYVFGIDNSEQMLKFAPKEASLTKGSAFKMPYKNNFFDRAVSMDLLVHFKSYEKLIIEMKRVVKKNGLIIFNIGNKEHIELGKKLFGSKVNLLYDSTGKSYTKPYYTAVSNNEIKKLSTKQNLKIVNIIPYNFFQGNVLFNNFTRNEKVLSMFYYYIYKLYHKKILSNFFQKFEKNVVRDLDIKFTFYKIVILKKLK